MSLRTTTSLVALLNSHPPKMRMCGPIEVAVCPYLLRGGWPSNFPFYQISSLSVFSTMKQLMSAGGMKFCQPRAPEFMLHPPKKMMSGPLMLALWPQRGSGGVPETRTRAHSYFSVSRMRMSLRQQACNCVPCLKSAAFCDSSSKAYPPCTIMLVPTWMAVCPILRVGIGPSHLGCVHAMTSRSRTKRSLKYSLPLVPPKMKILVSLTRTAVWPYLADGDPIPSGPCSQVMVTGSSACRSRKILPLAPRPPKMMILEPARTAEWEQRGAGGVPEILGLVNLLALTSRMQVSLRQAQPSVLPVQQCPPKMMMDAPERVAEWPPRGQGLTPSMMGQAHCQRRICSQFSYSSEWLWAYLRRTARPWSGSVGCAVLPALRRSVLSRICWRRLRGSPTRRTAIRSRP